MSVRLNGIWGSGSTDVWAVGYNGVVLHWNGAIWSVVDAGVPTVTFHSVWGSGPGDIWAVSDSVVMHWNGATWTASPTGGPRNLMDVWGFGPNDVWAVGASGLIMHWH